MNKADLIPKMAKAGKISKAAAGRALEAAIEGITATLKKGGRVTLAGFGSFSVLQRKARNVRHPQTGKPVNIPARRVPKFSAGIELKAAVRK